MIAVIQRISSGNVVVDGKVVAECGIGLYVLVGVTHEDTEEDDEEEEQGPSESKGQESEGQE